MSSLPIAIPTKSESSTAAVQEDHATADVSFQDALAEGPGATEEVRLALYFLRVLIYNLW